MKFMRGVCSLWILSAHRIYLKLHQRFTSQCTLQASSSSSKFSTPGINHLQKDYKKVPKYFKSGFGNEIICYQQRKPWFAPHWVTSAKYRYHDDNHCSKLTYCFIMVFLNWKDMTLSPLFGLPLPRGSDHFCGRGGEPSLPGGERFPQGGGPSLLHGPLSVSDWFESISGVLGLFRGLWRAPKPKLGHFCNEAPTNLY